MAEEAKKQTPRLHFGRLNPVEHARRELFADIPAGTDIKTVMQPDYWLHYASELRPMDLIEAFCEDGRWEASFRVFYISDTEVNLQPRWAVEYETSSHEAETDTHSIKWMGPARKFAVVHKGTGNVVKDGFYPKDKAHEFLRDHLREVRS